MSFVAECTFCRLMLQGVPDGRMGSSVECPRCHNCFTLAPMTQPAAAVTRGPRMARKPNRGHPPAQQPLADGGGSASPKPFQDDGGSGKPSRDRERAIENPLPDRGGLAIPSRECEQAIENPLPDSRGSVLSAGLVSFMFGSAAFLTAAIFHIGFLALPLGFLSLLVGIIGCFRSIQRPILSIAGTVVGLAAVILTVVLPSLLGLRPLWNNSPPVVRGGTAMMSLDGVGGLRPAAQGDAVWVDASSDALHHEDVRVRVISAIVGFLEFEPQQDRQPPLERGLAIRLRITNAGIARKVPFTTWGDPHAPAGPQLRDNQDKSYRLKTLPPSWIVKGRPLNSAIPSGKSLDDVVVFEAPPKSVEYLRLELPAASAGVKGTLRLEIPKHMIVFR